MSLVHEGAGLLLWSVGAAACALPVSFDEGRRGDSVLAAVGSARAALTEADSCAAPSGYSLTDLGTVGGWLTLDINDRGEVAGVTIDPATWDSRAVVWTTTEQATLLPSATASMATGISSDGRVAGWRMGTTAPVGIVWEGGATRELAPLRRDISSVGYAVNASGLAVGWSVDRSGNRTAVSWSDRRAQRLSAGPNAPAHSLAYAVNDSGQIVGSGDFNIAPFQRALMWSDAGMTALAGLGGGSDVAVAVSAAGIVAGSSFDPETSKYQAVLWQEGQVHALGYYQGGSTQALDVNDCATAVGEALLGLAEGGGGSTAGVIFRDGSIVALDDLVPASSGWTVFSARAIDNSGRIVALGLNQGSFGTHAVLLTPNPPEEEPPPAEEPVAMSER